MDVKHLRNIRTKMRELDPLIARVEKGEDVHSLWLEVIKGINVINTEANVVNKALRNKKRKIDAVVSPNIDLASPQDGRISMEKYTFIDVPGDGNCLFRAIAFAESLVNTKRSTSLDHKLLREIAAKYIDENFDWSPIRITQSENYSGRQFPNKKEYIKYISQNENWGGSMEIEALAEVLNLVICVIYADSESQTCFGYSKNRKHITIIFVDKNHYQVAVPS